MRELLETILTPGFGYSILRVTTPILLAGLGAAVTELAGCINIGIEGIMLAAALAGVVVGAFTQSALAGLAAAVAAGVLMALIMAYFSLNLKTDIILAGIALNLMASGGTVFLLYVVAHDKGVSSSLASPVLPQVTLPLIDRIPVLGEILSGHNVMVYVALLSVIVVSYLLYRTPFGLRLRAVGENPDAADSVGISVHRVQYAALIISGILAGFAGAHLSMGYVTWFARDMTAGRGFIGIAAEALGGRTPVGTFMGIPSEFVQMLPYVATVLALALYARRQLARRARLARVNRPAATGAGTGAEPGATTLGSG